MTTPSLPTLAPSLSNANRTLSVYLAVLLGTPLTLYTWTQPQAGVWLPDLDMAHVDVSKALPPLQAHALTPELLGALVSGLVTRASAHRPKVNSSLEVGRKDRKHLAKCSLAYVRGLSADADTLLDELEACKPVGSLQAGTHWGLEGALYTELGAQYAALHPDCDSFSQTIRPDQLMSWGPVDLMGNVCITELPQAVFEFVVDGLLSLPLLANFDRDAFSDWFFSINEDICVDPELFFNDGQSYWQHTATVDRLAIEPLDCFYPVATLLYYFYQPYQKLSDDDRRVWPTVTVPSLWGGSVHEFMRHLVPTSSEDELASNCLVLAGILLAQSAAELNCDGGSDLLHCISTAADWFKGFVACLGARPASDFPQLEAIL